MALHNIDGFKVSAVRVIAYVVLVFKLYDEYKKQVHQMLDDR